MSTRAEIFYGAIVLGCAFSFAACSSYDAKSASQKLDFLWTNIEADTKGDAFMNALGTLYQVEHPAYLWKMTKIKADWRAATHHKCTHGVGAHAKAHFVWKENNYTGMFQRADHCIIRMANAAAPGPYGPNLAIKCLRDGPESANLQFIWQLDGYEVIPAATEGSCSYFEAPLSNHCPSRDDVSMSLKDTFEGAFQKIDPHSMFVGVSQMASGTQSGTAGDITKPRFPWALVMKPAKGLNQVNCTFDDPVSQLLNLEEAGLGVPGKTLYDVYAVQDPSQSWKEPATPQHIGELVLDAPFTRSTYGDTQLFFRHIFFEEELKVVAANEPERAKAWTDYANNTGNYKHEGANIYWPLLPGGHTEAEAICIYTLTVGRLLNADWPLIVEGKVGDSESFHMGGCSATGCAPNGYCGADCIANGYGQGVNIILNQDGDEVAYGNCCFEKNWLADISKCSPATMLETDITILYS